MELLCDITSAGMAALLGCRRTPYRGAILPGLGPVLRRIAHVLHPEVRVKGADSRPDSRFG